MTGTAANLLVVANSTEATELEQLLAAAGFAVATGDGGDDTFNLYEDLLPDVVVLCANLDNGDARSLAGAMKDETHGKFVKIVLVGEEHGPIRNALDASDFDVDRFVGRPLSAKALQFAVSTCAKLSAEARSAAEETAVQVKPGASRLDALMDKAIDDFVQNAFDALDEADAIASDPSIDVPASEPAAMAVDEGWEETEAPPVREPTLILSGGGSMPPPRPAEPSPSLRSLSAVPRAETSDDDLDDILPPDPLGDLDDELEAMEADPLTDSGVRVLGEAVNEALAQRDDDARTPPPTGGAFARELRRKMSKMAERLFPDKGGADAEAIDVGVAHGASTEIDLASLTADTPAFDESGQVIEVPGAETHADVHDDSWRAAPVTPRPTTPRPVVRAPTNEPTNAIRREALTPQHHDTDGATVVQRATTSDVQSRGELSVVDTDVAMILARLFAAEFSGRVVFRRGGVDKTVLFEQGRPTFARSGLPHDRMGALLVREGKITSEQHEQCRAVVAESGRRMGAVLVEKGFLKRRELLPAVRRHIEDVIYSLFSWETGDYIVTHGEYAVDEKIRLSRHPAAIILEGIRRKYSVARLEHRFGSGGAIVSTTGEDQLKPILAAADLSQAERDAIAALAGDHDLTDIARDAGIDELAVFQLAFGLVILGAAKIVRRGEDGDTRMTPVRSPSLVGETDITIDRQRVLAKYAHVNEADYFTLLGVRRDASSFEIKRAYEAAMRDYAEESFPVEVRRQLDSEISEITELLTEAYQVLHNEQLRASYLANLRD